MFECVCACACACVWGGGGSYPYRFHVASSLFLSFSPLLYIDGKEEGYAIPFPLS